MQHFFSFEISVANYFLNTVHFSYLAKPVSGFSIYSKPAVIMRSRLFIMFSLFLQVISGMAQTVSLIPAGSSWKYLDNGSNQGTVWRSSSYNDLLWPAGNAQLGYGDGDETTIVGYGPSSSNKYITTYFRKTFSVSNPALYSALKVYILRDDGAVVYLNGTEVARSNISSGTVSYTKHATAQISGTAENTFYQYTVNKSLLLTGNNVIAVEVHQYNGSTPDLSFDLLLEATLAASCNVPASPSTSSITSTSAVAAWATVAGATGYNIQYRPSGTSTWSNAASSVNSVSMSQLIPGTLYEWQVQTVCAGGTSAFSGSSLFTTGSACSAPSGMNTAGITATAAILSWNAAAGAVSYNFQYRIAGNPSWIGAGSISNSVTVNSLFPASNYEWQVQTVCNGGSSAFSASSFFTTGIVCGTVTGLVSSGASSTTISLGWSAMPGALNYNIQLRPAGTTAWTTGTSSVNSASFGSLNAGTLYEWMVQAVCVNGAGAFSSSAFFSTFASGTDMLISSGSPWKYLDNGTNQGTAWQSSGFNDASWASGNSELGYGDGGEATVVGYGGNTNAKFITTYFRKSFNVANPLAYVLLKMDVVRDDGIVVYLNGNEVYRNNMPAGAVSYTTLAPLAIGNADESAWNSATLNVSSLVQGNNIIAVEIHQQASTSTDISFNLKLNASGQLPPPVTTRGPYLQKLTAGSIAVRWRTDAASNSTVQFGPTTSYGATVTDPSSTTEHIMNLTGLTPASRYYYSVGTTDYVLQGDTNNNFITAPLTGTAVPVRIWVTGDFGNNSASQDNVRNAYMNYPGANATNLWLWLGDNAYNSGTDAEYQTNVFNHYPTQLKKFPLYPSPGNHDYANTGYQAAATLGTGFPYFNIFSVPQAGEGGGVPSGTPKYYSYNYGNIHFISLDSYGALNSASSPMYQWLSSDLAANTLRWVIAYWHHPPYTKGTHNSDTDTELSNMRTNIIPLLESYHVDLVLCGHSHVNERSYMIKGHYGTSNTFNAGMKISPSSNTFTKTAPYDGTVYATCGTSGQNPGSLQAGAPMPCMYFTNNLDNCSMVIDVNGDNLNAKYLTASGTIADQFTITKSVLKEGVSPANNSTEAYYQSSDNMIFLNYHLATDAAVKVELLSMPGSVIRSFHDIPSYQSAGYYWQELSLNGASVADGIYLLRINVNGATEVKKLFIAR
jgi:hypothetical protein